MGNVFSHPPIPRAPFVFTVNQAQGRLWCVVTVGGLMSRVVAPTAPLPVPTGADPADPEPTHLLQPWPGGACVCL